jgi:hypothetical protein
MGQFLAHKQLLLKSEARRMKSNFVLSRYIRRGLADDNSDGLVTTQRHLAADWYLTFCRISDRSSRLGYTGTRDYNTTALHVNSVDKQQKNGNISAESVELVV